MVDPASSTSAQVWHRYLDTTKKPSDTTISFTSPGPFITSTTMQAAGASITCTFAAPGIPAPPWPPAVGKSFSVQGNCGSFTITVAGKVTDQRTVIVGGTKLAVWVLDTTITSTGAIKINGTQEDWISPSLRLSVHTYTNTSGSYGVYSFRGTATSDLESARPG